MFTSVEKLYVCCIKTRGGGGKKGRGREKETDLKLEKNFLVALQDLLSTGCLQLVKSTAMLA